VEEARAQALELRARSEAELSAARVEVREQQRAAREQAAALLGAARREADAAVEDGRDLTRSLKDVTDRVRELGRRLDAEVAQAHRAITERTTLTGVQARSRAEAPDLEASASAIAAQVVRILSDEAVQAPPPGEEPGGDEQRPRR
jgi:hypothetical protein